MNLKTHLYAVKNRAVRTSVKRLCGLYDFRYAYYLAAFVVIVKLNRLASQHITYGRCGTYGIVESLDP